MTTIYHNPACSKSREALAILRETAEPEIVEYLKTPLGEPELRALLAKLGISPRDLIRRKEARDIGLDLAADDATLIAAMATHPILIERPIVESGDKAVVARPPELARSL